MAEKGEGGLDCREMFVVGSAACIRSNGGIKCHYITTAA